MSASSSISSSSWRWARLYRFCTHTIGAIACASATCSAVALLTPRCRIRPCRWSSTSVSNGSASEPGWGPSASPSRRLTRSSTSRPRFSRFSWTARRRSSGSRAGGQPPCWSRVGADLGHDVQRFGVGVQRFTDQLVGDVWPVGVAGVDVGDAEVDGLAQDGERAVVVGGRPHDPGAGELHGAVAEPGDGQVAQRPGAAGKGTWRCSAHTSVFRVELGVLVPDGSCFTMER